MQTVICGNCQASLTVPDEMLGKRVRCPLCSETFDTAEPKKSAAVHLDASSRPAPPPLPPPPAADERRPTYRDREDGDDLAQRIRRRGADYDDDDGPRRRDDDCDDDDMDRPRGDRDGRRPNPAWRTVQSGLSTMFIAVIALAVSFLVLLIAMALIMSAQGRPNPGAAFVGVGLICTVVLAFFGCGIAYIVGLCLCLTAPRSKGWVLGSLLSGIAVVLVSFMLLAFEDGPGRRGRAFRNQNSEPAALLVRTLAGVLALASWACLIYFFRGVASHFRRPELARNCVYYLVFLVCFWLVSTAATMFGGDFITDVLRGRMPDLGAPHAALMLIFTAIGGMMSMVAVIWWLALARSTRNAIAEAFE